MLPHGKSMRARAKILKKADAGWELVTGMPKRKEQ
jgi:hypothetical protein